jgi:hypothetical protein
VFPHPPGTRQPGPPQRSSGQSPEQPKTPQPPPQPKIEHPPLQPNNPQPGSQPKMPQLRVPHPGPVQPVGVGTGPFEIVTEGIGIGGGGYITE